MNLRCAVVKRLANIISRFDSSPPSRVSFLDDAIMQFVTEESIGIEWSGEVIVAPPSTAHRRAETRIPANGGPLSVINRPVFAARRGEE